MTEAPETLGFRAFADRIRVKPSYVTELRKAGRLVLTEDQRGVRVAESIALIESTRDPTKAGVAARHAAARAAEPPANAPQSTEPPADDDVDAGERPDGEADTPPATSAFHTHRAERERWQALAAKRDYELSIGKLMQASEVEGAVAQAGTLFRRALERLPDTLAPQLAAATDEARVRAILAVEIEHALRDLAREFAAIGKPGQGTA
jgi:hypothetical protein